jgi:hypothetical protein
LKIEERIGDEEKDVEKETNITLERNENLPD